LASQVYNSLN